jgi:hypothetical protein
MSELNKWHELNYRRMGEAFAPAHATDALIVCVGEELGELCAAVLGVTGEKKRKAHKTEADVLDACADAATYLSLVISSLGYSDLVEVVTRESQDPGQRLFGPLGAQMQMVPMSALVRVQELVGGLCFSFRCGNRDAAVSYAARSYIALASVARGFGCDNWMKLLGDTFNMVSDRAGWAPRTTLGQR